MLSKLGGVTGQMFPVTSEEKELKRTVPVSYSNYKANTVTVVTAVQVNGISLLNITGCAKGITITD